MHAARRHRAADVLTGLMLLLALATLGVAAWGMAESLQQAQGTVPDFWDVMGEFQAIVSEAAAAAAAASPRPMPPPPLPPWLLLMPLGCCCRWGAAAAVAVAAALGVLCQLLPAAPHVDRHPLPCAAMLLA